MAEGGIFESTVTYQTALTSQVHVKMINRLLEGASRWARNRFCLQSEESCHFKVTDVKGGDQMAICVAQIAAVTVYHLA